MRNLKKILALVLALVMSLSLMATASAADFKDASDISENYQTAVNVLEGLKVFKGYAEDNTFRPKGEITRAEVATIIYRIATGDAEDAQASIYTNMTTSFTDLDKAEWARGYVNYCHNAQIIKGESATKFNPNGKITGYATLAMILRAMGYGKNGEFEGAQWEYQTAAKAKEIGLIDNVIEAQLGSNAPRELVAEILFRALLTEMVDYTVLNGYQTNGKTLGKENLGLESVEGVIVANEYADLYSTQVLDEGKTHLEEADGTIRTLDVTTTLEDIGESRHVYTQNGSKILDLADTGLNTTNETGDATDIRSNVQFQTAAGMPAASDIEYYVNFGRVGTYTCDQRLELTVTFEVPRAEQSFDSYADTNISVIAAVEDDWTVVTKAGTAGSTNVTNATGVNGDYANIIGTDDYPVRYSKIIRAGVDISNADMAVIEGIFGAADNNIGITDNLNAWDRIEGDVYVGTYSSTVTPEDRDISNKISFNKFFEDYINDITYDVNWNVSFNGEWVKFIDNDGDGKCDYAFVTGSWLDEALDTYTKGDTTILEYNSFDDNNEPRVTNGGYKVRYMDGAEIKVGDKVICARIDNQILVAPAVTDTVKVTSYSWRDDEITVTGGAQEKYGQSGIGNATEMLQEIDTMDENVEYVLYLDHFGFVRAYEVAGGTKYALITEVYASNNNNGNIVRNTPMTIELTTPDDDGVAQTNEYSFANAAVSPIFTTTCWTMVQSTYVTSYYYNWLQPAISHLGVNRTVNLNGGGTLTLGPVQYAPSFKPSNTSPNTYSFWSLNRQAAKSIAALGTNTARTITSGEFNYGEYKWRNASNAELTSDATVSFTNVGIVNIQDNSATVNAAAQLKLDSNGNPMWFDTNNNNRWDAGERARYAVDYVQLSTDDIAAKAVRYGIAHNDPNDPTYVADNNTYVNAVDETEYYIVYNGGVQYYKGFSNFPGLTNAKNTIRAAYAVARDISADNAGQPYWVADVIVYEVLNWTDTARTSVSLAYYTPSRTSGDVQLIKTLNSKYGPMVDLTPGQLNWEAQRGQWGAQWMGYGFYGLNNDTEPVDNVMTARSIERIRNTVVSDGNYGKNNIHAGILTREAYIANGGEYIDIDTTGDGVTDVSLEVTDKVYSVTTNWAQSGDWYDYNEATQLRYTNISNSQVKAGDRVIWVGDAKTDGTKNSSKFVVDLGNDVTSGVNANSNLRNATPDFLYSWTYDGNGNRTTAQVISNASNGEWQKIMAEQGYTAPAANRTLTFKFVSAVLNDPNFPAKPDLVVSYPVSLSDPDTYTLMQATDADVAPFAIPGYKINAVTDKTAATATSKPTINYANYAAATGNAWTVVVGTGATAAAPVTLANNMVVEIAYTPVPNTVTGAAAGTGVTTVAAAEYDSTNTTAAGNTATLSTPANLSNVEKDNWVQLTITLTNAITANQRVSVSVTKTSDGTAIPALSGTASGSGTAYTYNFQMPAYGVTVAVAVSGNPYTITVSGGELSAPASGAREVSASYTGTESVTLTAAAGYQITNVVVSDPNAVDSTSAFGLAASTYPATTGAVVLKAGTNKNVTVTVTTELVKYSTVTFDMTAGTGWTGQVEAWIVYANGGESNHVSATGGTVSITNANFTVKDTLMVKANGAVADGSPELANGDNTSLIPGGIYNVAAPVEGSNGTAWTITGTGISSTTGTVTVQVNKA